MSGLELSGWSLRFSWWGDIGGKRGCFVKVGCSGEIGLIIECVKGH